MADMKYVANVNTMFHFSFNLCIMFYWRGGELGEPCQLGGGDARGVIERKA